MKIKKKFIYHILFLLVLFFDFNTCKNSAKDFTKYFAFAGSSSGQANPKIISAVPGTGDNNLPKNQKIVVLFDRAMNINSCIQAFSIQPNVRGYFSTDSYSMTFTPTTQWDYGSYTYTITKFCEDSKGNDIKDVFTANFSIGDSNSAGSSPTVTSATVVTGTSAACNSSSGTTTNFLNAQVNNACMGNSNSNQITLTFNRAMDRSLTQAAIGIAPSFSYSSVWQSDTVLTITSDFGLTYNQRYTINISTTAQDAQGVKMTAPISASFFVGTPNLIPAVNSIQVASGAIAACTAGTATNTDILTTNVTTGCLGNPTVNPVIVTFNTPMDTASAQSAFSFSPSTTGNFIWSAGNTVLTFTPDTSLQSGVRYTVTVNTTAQSSNKFGLTSQVTGSFVADSASAASLMNTITVLQGTMQNCNGGVGTALDILTNTVNNGCLGNPTTNSIVWNFNFAMNTSVTVASISISPSVPGSYAWSGGNQVLTLTPDSKLTYGTRYTITISTSAETSAKIKLSNPVITSFVAGNLVTTPGVQAIGVASQSSCTTFPGTGGGGDWLTANCFWDDTMAVQTPTAYLFRAGDDGTGASGSSNACADVTSDNFRLIFNTYMDTNTTISAISLKRLSPPLTTIALSSWIWSDCQAVYPFGCRVLTLSYSEQEASCNGNLFGTGATGGDFNLLRTDNTSNGIPFYQISVNSSAKDVNGVYINPFNFSMEGN